MMANTTYDAIICDGEGVVFDTEGIWDLAQSEFLRRRGITYDRALVKPMLAGRSQADGMRILMSHFDLDGPLDALIDERRTLFWNHVHDHVDLMAGFDAWWSRMADGSQRALATSLARDILDVVAQRLQLHRYFARHLYSISDIVGESKPAPDLFLHAANCLGVEPTRCLVIEDSPVGLEAARRAGMRSVGLATTFPRAVLSAADLVVERWDQIDAATLANLPRRA